MVSLTPGTLKAGDVVAVKPESGKPFLALVNGAGGFFVEDGTSPNACVGQVILLGHEANREDHAQQTLEHFRRENFCELLFTVAELQAELIKFTRKAMATETGLTIALEKIKALEKQMNALNGFRM